MAYRVVGKKTSEGGNDGVVLGRGYHYGLNSGVSALG